MRYRVDTRFGYISYDEKDELKAWKAFRENGELRLRRCKDLFDEGVVIAGLPLHINLDPDRWSKKPE